MKINRDKFIFLVMLAMPAVISILLFDVYWDLVNHGFPW